MDRFYQLYCSQMYGDFRRHMLNSIFLPSLIANSCKLLPQLRLNYITLHICWAFWDPYPSWAAHCAHHPSSSYYQITSLHGRIWAHYIGQERIFEWTQVFHITLPLRCCDWGCITLTHFVLNATFLYFLPKLEAASRFSFSLILQVFYASASLGCTREPVAFSIHLNVDKDPKLLFWSTARDFCLPIPTWIDAPPPSRSVHHCGTSREPNTQHKSTNFYVLETGEGQLYHSNEQQRNEGKKTSQRDGARSKLLDRDSTTYRSLHFKRGKFHAVIVTASQIFIPINIL